MKRNIISSFKAYMVSAARVLFIFIASFIMSACVPTKSEPSPSSASSASNKLGEYEGATNSYGPVVWSSYGSNINRTSSAKNVSVGDVEGLNIVIDDGMKRVKNSARYVSPIKLDVSDFQFSSGMKSGRTEFAPHDQVLPNYMKNKTTNVSSRTKVFYDHRVISRGYDFYNNKRGQSNHSLSNSVSFNKDWSQGFDANGIKILVLDSGVTKKALDKLGYFQDAKVEAIYYERQGGNEIESCRNEGNVKYCRIYGDGNNNKKNFINNALNGGLFNKQIETLKPKLDAPARYTNHGDNVIRTITYLASAPTIYSIDIFNNRNHIDINNGVRFINRSFSVGTAGAQGIDSYAPGILYRNVLVISAAGNDNRMNNAENFINYKSRLRKGWLVVAGYEEVEYKVMDLVIFKVAKSPILGEDNGRRREEARGRYYVKGERGMVNVFLGSNPCGVAKWDCVTAPLSIEDLTMKADKGLVTNNNYSDNWNFSGTSAGSPMVTAVAATILDKYPWMSNQNIKDTILTTALKVTDITGKQIQQDIDEVWGWGILNASKAMNGPASFYAHDYEANVNVRGPKGDNDYDFLSIFSNDINGKYGLIKNGNGWLALTGNNTFKGETNINEGGLWISKNISSNVTINTNGTLRGTRAVFDGDVNNGGAFFSEGNNNIKGSYYHLKNAILYTNFGDKLTINKDANIYGGTLDFIHYVTGSALEYEVIKASGGLNGRFDEIKASSSLINILKSSYTDKSINVHAERKSLDGGNTDFSSASFNLNSLFRRVDDNIYKIIIDDYEARKVGNLELKGGELLADARRDLPSDNKIIAASYDKENKENQEDEYTIFSNVNNDAVTGNLAAEYVKRDALGRELSALFNMDDDALSESIYAQGGYIYPQSIMLNAVNLSNHLRDLRVVSKAGITASYVYHYLSLDKSKINSNLRSNTINIGLHINDQNYFLSLAFLNTVSKMKMEFKGIKDEDKNLGFGGVVRLGYSEKFIVALEGVFDKHNHETTRNIKSDMLHKVNAKFNSSLLFLGANVGYKFEWSSFSLTPLFSFINENIMVGGISEKSSSETIFNTKKSKLSINVLEASVLMKYRFSYMDISMNISASRDLNKRLLLINDHDGIRSMSNIKFPSTRYNGHLSVAFNPSDYLNVNVGVSYGYPLKYIAGQVGAKYLF